MKRLIPLTLALVAGLSAGAAAQAAPAGERADIVAQLDDAATKLVQLAEAIPQEKYSWRPGPGVRSVSEVFMHVAGANYYFPSFLGVRAQSPLPNDAEKSVTTKAQVVSSLKGAIDQFRGVIRGLSDADLNKPATMFGRQTTYRNVLLTVVSHHHEHLGQMIAYARSNGITPPWSAAGT
jgi:uncharacterized damage-inducible protein DinB